ncbi:MAG TPA: hypothetical protein VN698_10700 [Bacteroidia bacterium]|nr:hypothetical protein [Bacteroidia bacterium]
MKKITSLLLFALFLLGTLAFTKSDGVWYPFESKAFGFKVEFPAKPIEKVKVIDTEQGELNLNLFEYVSKKTNTEPELVYIVSYIEYPTSNINTSDKVQLKQFYKTEADKLVAKMQGKLIKETIINLEGFEGAEYRIEIKDGLEFIKMRLYLINNKLYMVETVTVTKNEFNKHINRFMNSFKLIK